MDKRYKKNYKKPKLKKIGLIAKITKKDGSSTIADSGSSWHRAPNILS